MMSATKCYGYFQGTKRYVHTVSNQELSHYRESLKRFYPRAYPVSGDQVWRRRPILAYKRPVKIFEALIGA